MRAPITAARHRRRRVYRVVGALWLPERLRDVCPRAFTPGRDSSQGGRLLEGEVIQIADITADPAITC